MPASRARWMMRVASAVSLLPQGPNIIAPRHRGLTCTPVRPSGRYSMFFSPLGFGDGHGEPLRAGHVRVRTAADAGIQGVNGSQVRGGQLKAEHVEVFGDACRVGGLG